MFSLLLYQRNIGSRLGGLNQDWWQHFFKIRIHLIILHKYITFKTNDMHENISNFDLVIKTTNIEICKKNLHFNKCILTEASKSSLSRICVMQRRQITALLNI